MAIVNCPSCRRGLNLPNHLRGQLLQCPACGTTFELPAEPLPVAALLPLPIPEQASTPPPPDIESPGPDANAIAFGLDSEDQVTYYRVRNMVDDAVTWLHRTTLFDAMGIHLCFPCLLLVIVTRERWLAET